MIDVKKNLTTYLKHKTGEESDEAESSEHCRAEVKADRKAGVDAVVNCDLLIIYSGIHSLLYLKSR